jgi:hypothetical protein
MINPQEDLGFDFLGTVRRSPSDKPSVQQITARVAQGLSSHVESVVSDAVDSVDLDMPFDDLFVDSRGGERSRFAHLRIDLRATKVQLRRDFSRWLDDYLLDAKKPTNRAYTPTLVRRWVRDKLLPYADLMIFAKCQDARVSPSLLCELLEINGTSVFEWDSIRTQQRALRELFNVDEALSFQLAVGPMRIDR